jgi:hypothetical protein
MRKTFAFCLALTSIVSGCSTAQVRPTPRIITAEEARAITLRVVDCEWKAADRYDDGRSTVTVIAQRIIGICAVELTRARVALSLSPNDPEIELDEFKRATDIVEKARKSRAGSR